MKEDFMFDIFIIVLIIAIIAFTFGLIYKRMKDYKKVEILKLVSLGKINALKNGFIFNLIFFIVYLGIFIYKTNKVYQILNQEYLENIFQLFSINYLEPLMTYFYEKEMLFEFFRVNQFRNEFLFSLVPIIAEFCIFTYRFYLTKVENLIYSYGLLLNGKLTPWDTIKSYQWQDQKGFLIIKR